MCMAGVGVRVGVRGAVGKKQELPGLNKVNFPAIWSVFGIEREALKAGGATK